MIPSGITDGNFCDSTRILFGLLSIVIGVTIFLPNYAVTLFVVLHSWRWLFKVFLLPICSGWGI